MRGPILYPILTVNGLEKISAITILTYKKQFVHFMFLQAKETIGLVQRLKTIVSQVLMTFELFDQVSLKNHSFAHFLLRHVHPQSLDRCHVQTSLAVHSLAVAAPSDHAMTQ